MTGETSWRGNSRQEDSVGCVVRQTGMGRRATMWNDIRPLPSHTSDSWHAPAPPDLQPLLISSPLAPDSRASTVYELLWPVFNPTFLDHSSNREVNRGELRAGPTFRWSRPVLRSGCFKYIQRIQGNYVERKIGSMSSMKRWHQWLNR